MVIMQETVAKVLTLIKGQMEALAEPSTTLEYSPPPIVKYRITKLEMEGLDICFVMGDMEVLADPYGILEH